VSVCLSFRLTYAQSRPTLTMKIQMGDWTSLFLMNHVASTEHLPSLRDGNWLKRKRHPIVYEWPAPKPAAHDAGIGPYPLALCRRRLWDTCCWSPG